MSDLLKLADALDACAYTHRSETHQATCREAAAILRAAAKVDVLDLMAMVDDLCALKVAQATNRPHASVLASHTALETVLRLALAQLKEPWLPIKDAPKDGTKYIATNHTNHYEIMNEPPGCWPGLWDFIDGEWRGAASGFAATHFQYIQPVAKEPQ